MSDDADVVTKDRWPLKVALLGAGRIGTNHGEILANRVPGVELAMIFDPVDGAAARLADSLHVPTATQSIEDVWRNPEIDAVVIAAPARSHTDLVVAAAAAGTHVFVEKPMAITLEDADRAIAAAGEAGVVLQVGFNRRFAAGWAAARRAIDAGAIGNPAVGALPDPRPRTVHRRSGAHSPVDHLLRDLDSRLRRAVLPQPGREAGAGDGPRRRAGASRCEGRRPLGHRRRDRRVRQRRDRRGRGELQRPVRLRRPRRGLRIRGHGHGGRRAKLRDGRLQPALSARCTSSWSPRRTSPSSATSSHWMS